MAEGSGQIDGLLAAVARQDSAAFAELYGAASPKLFAICLRILRNRSTAEDVLQEVFVKIWQDASRFDPKRGSAMAWLAVMARNRAIDALRRQGRKAMTTGDEDMPAFIDPSTGAGRAEDRMALVACLAQLGDHAREMVLLAYYEGYTRDELAERYDRPTGTIKTWLRAALKSLRGCLSGTETGT